MADQTVNYVRPGMGAPILLGAAGVGTGLLVAGPKKGYKTALDLISMDEAHFKKVAPKGIDNYGTTAKEWFEKIVAERKAYFGKIKTETEKAIAAGKTEAQAAAEAEVAGNQFLEQLVKGETFKDFKAKNIKEILPKAKAKWAIILGIVGILIGRVISVNKAIKKNVAIAQAQQAQTQQA